MVVFLESIRLGEVSCYGRLIHAKAIGCSLAITDFSRVSKLLALKEVISLATGLGGK